MELARTKAFDSFETKLYKEFTRFKVSGSSGEISYILGTLNTAVFRTYGSSSLRAIFKGSTKYSLSFGTLSELIVLTAKALMIGLALLAASFLIRLIHMMASSGRTRE